MTREGWWAVVGISLVFGALAGGCAFLISYQEYEHPFPDPRRVWWASMETGIVAFLFFGILSTLIFLWFPVWLKPL